MLTFVPFSYFRHWLNLVILHSVWTEFDLIPCVHPPSLASSFSLPSLHPLPFPSHTPHILHSSPFPYQLLTLPFSEIHRRWAPPTGAWLTWWMKYQIFAPILLLQILNLFWYYLMWRILIRAIRTAGEASDVRSDDEDDGEEEEEGAKEK